jgi:hypothetical protein
MVTCRTCAACQPCLAPINWRMTEGATLSCGHRTHSGGHVDVRILLFFARLHDRSLANEVSEGSRYRDRRIMAELAGRVSGLVGP